MAQAKAEDVIVTGTYVTLSPETAVLPLAEMPVAEPATVATADVVVDDGDAALAARLQAEEDLLAAGAPAPPAIRTRFVESHYYGPASFLSSLMLFCIFPPCAIVPCIAPCDTRAYAIVADDAEPAVFARRRRARHLFVRVPSGTRPGDVVQTTAPDGRVVSARVPLRTGPGDMLRIDF